MYPEEYIRYLVHFHGDRDYFECHEILEEYWKKIDGGNKNSVWVGLIQLAVSCYHHRRGNFNGAKKTLKKALTIFSEEKETLTKLGINEQALTMLLQEQLAIIEKKQVYYSYNLPINDPLLIQLCIAACSQQGVIWCSKSNMTNTNLLHRHKLRDRTDIIHGRHIAITNRKGSE